MLPIGGRAGAGPPGTARRMTQQSPQHQGHLVTGPGHSARGGGGARCGGGPIGDGGDVRQGLVPSAPYPPETAPRNGKGALGEAPLPASEPGLVPRRVAGVIGGHHSRTYGEALVTGPASLALCPANGRCVGEVARRGREAHAGVPGVAPRANTAHRVSVIMAAPAVALAASSIRIMPPVSRFLV